MASRRPTAAEILLLASAGIAVFVYPVLAARALAAYGGREVATIALAVALGSFVLRRWLERRTTTGLLVQYAPGVVLLGAAILLDASLPLLLFPALVNLYLAAAFAWTLHRGPSMVERGAALIQPHLPEFTRSYCRRITALWVLFFGVNAGVIAWLALRSPGLWWPFYTTWIYFGAVTLFSGVEFLVRKIWFRHYGSGPLDRLFSALFPAKNTARGRRSEAYLDEMRRLGLKTD
jgi:uncharacterized membrane protein